MSQVFPSGVVEMESKDGSLFKVIEHRIKNYVGPIDEVKLLSIVYLNKV